MELYRKDFWVILAKIQLGFIISNLYLIIKLIYAKFLSLPFTILLIEKYITQVLSEYESLNIIFTLHSFFYYIRLLSIGYKSIVSFED